MGLCFPVLVLSSSSRKAFERTYEARPREPQNDSVPNLSRAWAMRCLPVWQRQVPAKRRKKKIKSSDSHYVRERTPTSADKSSNVMNRFRNMTSPLA